MVTSLREGGDELLTFFSFPEAQWKTLRTTNFDRITRPNRGPSSARLRCSCCPGRTFRGQGGRGLRSPPRLIDVRDHRVPGHRTRPPLPHRSILNTCFDLSVCESVERDKPRPTRRMTIHSILAFLHQSVFVQLAVLGDVTNLEGWYPDARPTARTE